MIKAIIFDCFGVIRPDRLKATYVRFGGDLKKDAEFIHDTISAVNHGHIQSSRPVFAERLSISVEEWMSALNEDAGNDQRLLSCIKQLRKSYKTGLLSNVGRAGFTRIFASGELEQYFDAAVASAEVGYVKPEPEIYHLMAAKLNVAPEECIMVDDQQPQCDGARAVGMQAILYVSFDKFKLDLDNTLPSE